MFSCSKCCGDKDTSETGEKITLIPTRLAQCFLLFLGMALNYALRMDNLVSMTPMTDANVTDNDAEVFDWNKLQRSYIFKSFFWSYTLTQIPGGYFAIKFGPKLPIFISILCCSILSLLTPICAKTGDWPLMIALRALQGLCQGVLLPSTHQFIAKWAPVGERAKCVGFVYSGSLLGTILSLITCDYIAESPLGWPSSFYLIGFFGIIWSVFWYLFSVNSPFEHKTITYYEKQLIAFGNEQKSSDIGAPLKPPWGKILTCGPFYVILMAFCCNSFGLWVLFIEMPIYIQTILNFNILSGPLIASPYLSCIILCYIFIYINGLITHQQWMTLNASRKSFNSFAQWIPMIVLSVMGYLTTDESKNWAILLLFIAFSTNAAFYIGAFVNPIDLSPNFAGTLMGILNFFANIASYFAPQVVDAIVTDEKNVSQWRIVFFITSGFYLVASLTFIFFAKTNVQSWNNPK